MKTAKTAKTKVSKKVSKPILKQEDYQLTVKIFGKDYISTGSTLIEALNKLEIRNVRGRCIMTVTKGDKSKERVLMPALVFRLFNSHGISKEVTIKNISMLFDL